MTNETTQPTEIKNPTYTVMLLRPKEGRRSYPTRIGVSFETRKGNQRILWDIIPAGFELRDCETILVPYVEQGEEQSA
jgi:hypothetical protein